ncbi:unnamed protein product [Darwinula stevensoni]|uniref:DNA helicase MCM9 n=1 Tax=Darwinula stevensoni TaxID=69355 RepID=A0A7R9A1F7_9CRUS|nr:unnamed protein product [Darwinula stevensoni]CAG0886541.1 unnamed protein product [Darwinula stevensoni]
MDESRAEFRGLTSPPHYAADSIRDFAISHYQEDLMSILQSTNVEGHYSITVRFSEMMNHDVYVSEAVMNDPIIMLEELRKGFSAACRRLFLAAQESQQLDLTVKANIHIRLSDLPVCPEVHRVNLPGASDVGRLLCITGTVIRTTGVKMLEYQREFICSKCKHIFGVKADYEKYYTMSRPMMCLNPDGCSGTNFTRLGSIDPVFCKDYQEIKIQERASHLGLGRIPQSMWVTLEDDLVDSCKPGDDVVIIGVIRRRWKQMNRDMRPDINLVIQANHIHVNNKQRPIISIDGHFTEEVEEFWRTYEHAPLDGRNFILANLCPQIFGLYTVKLALALVMAGGVRKVDPSGTRLRGESHLLLVGDPGTGKSQILRYAARLSSRSVLTTGIGTTSAGLTVSAIKDGGEWQLEAGALVLADGGVCCIDEFCSIREHDRASIHEALEQQTISVAKAGLVCKLNTRCTILAATNPKGSYDPESPLSVNTSLASPLLSRFDLILTLLDNRNHNWDLAMSDHLLGGKKIEETEEEEEESLWGLEKLRAYFSYIRGLRPGLSEDACVILRHYYAAQRKSSIMGNLRVTIRLLESLIRLSQAHSKLCCSEEVRVMDAVAAVAIMESSLRGGVILPPTNALHTAFPKDPMQEYHAQMSLILDKLGLHEILKKEIAWLNSLKSGTPQPHPRHPLTSQPMEIHDENLEFLEGERNFLQSVVSGKTENDGCENHSEWFQASQATSGSSVPRLTKVSSVQDPTGRDELGTGHSCELESSFQDIPRNVKDSKEGKCKRDSSLNEMQGPSSKKSRFHFKRNLSPKEIRCEEVEEVNTCGPSHDVGSAQVDVSNFLKKFAFKLAKKTQRAKVPGKSQVDHPTPSVRLRCRSNPDPEPDDHEMLTSEDPHQLMGVNSQEEKRKAKAAALASLILSKLQPGQKQQGCASMGGWESAQEGDGGSTSMTSCLLESAQKTKTQKFSSSTAAKLREFQFCDDDIIND